MERPDTRTRIVAATATLFQRQGMTGTGLKQIAQVAQAPFGSIYHFFPGGKAELTAEVIRVSGAMYRDVVMSVFKACPDLPTAVTVAFGAAAEHLEITEWADGCPIETIALEVASTDETLRIATSDVFNDWIESGIAATAESGLSEDVRRRLIIGLITSLEGAFVLARAMHSREPLIVAGQTVLAAVNAELAARGERSDGRSAGHESEDGRG